MNSSKDNEGTSEGRKGVLGRLRSAGFAPRKSLGQHFLHDPRILASLAESSEVDGDSNVLEIGTGPATLTRELAGRSASVLTVEIDERMGSFAAAELAGFDNVEILQLDALDGKRRLNPLLFDRLVKLGDFTWVSNLPYQIATTVIIALLEAGVSWQRAVLTVQNEVAERICSPPVVQGKGKRVRAKAQKSIGYGPASLLVGYWARAQYLKKISPGSFWPPPKVDSAVILLEPRYKVVTNQIEKDYRSFSKWVQILFQKRRKQLGGSLRGVLGQDAANKALTERGLDAALRPENLHLEDFQFFAKTFPFNNG